MAFGFLPFRYFTTLVKVIGGVEYNNQFKIHAG